MLPRIDTEPWFKILTGHSSRRPRIPLCVHELRYQRSRYDRYFRFHYDGDTVARFCSSLSGRHWSVLLEILSRNQQGTFPFHCSNVTHGISSNSGDSNRHQNLPYVCTLSFESHFLRRCSALHAIRNYRVRAPHRESLSCRRFFPLAERRVSQRVPRSSPSSSRWPALPSSLLVVVPSNSGVWCGDPHRSAQRYNFCSFSGRRSFKVFIRFIKLIFRSDRLSDSWVWEWAWPTFSIPMPPSRMVVWPLKGSRSSPSYLRKRRRAQRMKFRSPFMTTQPGRQQEAWPSRISP